MATKKKTVGEKTPTKPSYVKTILSIIKEVEQEIPSNWNKIKISALKIFLSACKYTHKKDEADKKLNDLKDKI
jgi:hypothetical protein